MNRLHYLDDAHISEEVVRTACGKLLEPGRVTARPGKVTCGGCRRSLAWQEDAEGLEVVPIPAPRRPALELIREALRDGPKRPCDVAREVGITARRVRQLAATTPEIRRYGPRSRRVLRWKAA